MTEEARRKRFVLLVLPHMDAAFSLARWITRDRAQAEDAVQEAYLRAYRFFGGLRGGDARPWLFGIVRNTCYTLMDRERRTAAGQAFDERAIGEDQAAAGASVVRFPVDPEAAAIAHAERETLERALHSLPDEFREAIALRELQGCSYREIAEIVEAPIGTVMSRLSRGRRLLRLALAATQQKPIQAKGSA